MQYRSSNIKNVYNFYDFLFHMNKKYRIIHSNRIKKQPEMNKSLIQNNKKNIDSKKKNLK